MSTQSPSTPTVPSRIEIAFALEDLKKNLEKTFGADETAAILAALEDSLVKHGRLVEAEIRSSLEVAFGKHAGPIAHALVAA